MRCIVRKPRPRYEAPRQRAAARAKAKAAAVKGPATAIAKRQKAATAKVKDATVKGQMMGKTIVVVNAGPRRGWNTDTLLTEAAEGAREAGATVRKFDLFRLEKYTGCVSCFGCKKEANAGRCVCNDGLTEVLDAIRSADGLIVGSPNYLSEMTASFRALYERLVFQNLTYNAERPCCNQHPIPVLLVMTSNAPDTQYENLLKGYQQTLSAFVGPARTFVSGDTLQLKNYGKTDWEWSFFDPEAKRLRHETVFPEECRAIRQLGSQIVQGW